MSNSVAIIGAGMAGLSCAGELARLGLQVTLFDKGRGPGGRMSTRRIATPLGEASFDHGAQYFTARDPAFSEQVAIWHKADLVAPWPPAGEGAWVGIPGMNAPVKAMANALDVRWGKRVTPRREGRGWEIVSAAGSEGTFDSLVVAVPAEQVPDLIADFDDQIANAARTTPSEPCWTVMATFSEGLPAEAQVLKGSGPIGWAAMNSAKPGRTGPEAWVIQATGPWSKDHLEDDAGDVGSLLLSTFATAMGIKLPRPQTLDAHRWRYAKSGAHGSKAIWNQRLRLGACGDWLMAPRVEAAWLSGGYLATLVGGG